jgi:hypothetical protein
MKKQILTLFFFVAIGLLSYGQSTDKLVSNCVMNAGSNARYLKDFRIQLGKAIVQDEFRVKEKMSLWKNTKYRFSMCNADDSKGQLILSIKDQNKKVVLSSFDKKSGKTYPSVDFTCNAGGIYELSFDFTDGQQGSGVVVVSMVK